MLLYAVTDRTWLGEDSFETQVEETIKSGTTFIQLREKNLGFNEFKDMAISIKNITDRFNIPFVINDNIDVALAVDADGVHVGQRDMNVKDVRATLGKDKIVGVSVQTVEQALQAQSDGADYIGVGAIFSTATKNDADNVTMQTLSEICKAVDISVVAIGGINEHNIMKLKGSGIDGVAVVSAIFSKSDIIGSTKELFYLINKIVNEK